jgi:hypothetical protein
MDVFAVDIVINTFNAIQRWAGTAYVSEDADPLLVGLWCGTGIGIFPEWCGTSRVDDIARAALHAGYTPTLQLWEWIQMLRFKLRSRLLPAVHGLPCTRELTQVRQCLNQICTIAQIDRNQGCLFLQCPLGYWTKLQEQYINSANYRVSGMSRASVIELWKVHGEKSGIPGTFDLKGELPYGYINPKDKDVTRFRPIVSFAAAPHRRQLNLCARGLYFILQQMPRSHYTLWNAWDSRKCILEASAELLAQDLNATMHSRIMATVADIKDMYTALPHKHIEKAVVWALTSFTKTKRRDRVNVARTGRPEGRTGRVYDEVARVEILLPCLFKYVQHILQSCYFTCGDQLLIQYIGVPMGNHLSPTLAIASCMYCESIYTSSMTIRRPLVGLRYMDDILHITLVHATASTSLTHVDEEEATQALASAKDIYPASLRVLTTDSVQPLSFLELELAWSGTKPIFQYADRSTRQRFKDGRSFTTRASLVSLVQCMLQRGIQFPSTVSLQLQACTDLICEFGKMNYSVRILKDAIHRLRRTNTASSNFWQALEKLV